MVALFALGAMSLTWMAVPAALIAAEKLLPWRFVRIDLSLRRRLCVLGHAHTLELTPRQASRCESHAHGLFSAEKPSALGSRSPG
ncbi:hypothetical protein [Actinospica sp.]|jgi:hypothetical protein|uniref:hypothetical protein n=1 Tax=Actinospica sp. TaxID=1872142 RepID=UPI0039C86CFC